MEKENIEVAHTGGCHCGAVRFKVMAPSRVQVTICNCSVCVKKQIQAFIVREEKFHLLQGQSSLTQYSFNTQAAKHYFCKVCGVQSFYKPRSNPDGISVMIYCIDPGTIEGTTETSFNGQDWEAAIQDGVPEYN